MKRKLSNLLHALTALLFILSAIVWPLSYFMSYRLQRYSYWLDSTTQPAQVATLGDEIFCSGGQIQLSRGRSNSALYGSVPSPGGHWASELSIPRRSFGNRMSPFDSFNLRFAGFQIQFNAASNPPGWWTGKVLILPLWSFLLFGVPPLLWWRRRRRPDRGFTVQTLPC